MFRTLAVLAGCIVLFCQFGFAQDMVKEPSTGKMFPATVKVTHEGKDYTLKLTGVAVRKKVVFKVYGLAHYMQDPVNTNEEGAYKAALTDGKAKQLTLDFARDVDAQSIKNAYRDGFKENATAEELKKIQPMIDQLLGYFTTEVKENQKFVLRWLPDGIVLVNVAGEEKPPLKDATFARVFWSIWLGEDSIVDREDLVQKMIAH
jgi:hypothetical protein